MTLEEAIKHCEEVANDRAGCCEDCAEEHRQLACWLKELKQYREQTGGDLISRKAVIDMLNKLIEVEQKQGTDVMNYGRERVNAYESILDEIESDYLFPPMPSAEKTTLSAEKTTITDTDLISRQAVITMLQKIENAVEDGDGFQFNEWIEYAKDIPSADKTALKDIDCEEIGCNCENCKLYLNAKETRGNKPCK